MSYERMRVFCMFDLPTETTEEQKQYRIFRKGLIANGFDASIFSLSTHGT